ncbi:MAG: hypothetical protein K2L50_04875 [Bacteroidales bacterium]|nr:hypothetical protein [Bacteroidales bacterium]
MKLKALVSVAFLACAGIAATASAQSKFEEVMGRGTLSGNIQIDAQMYFKDSLIGSPEVPEKFRSNSFAYLQYTNGKFTLGARFEGYFKPMLGYDDRLDGWGVPYYFARFSGDIIDITAGSFYEQFGSGMILRSYQDWNLGIDNAISGVRAIIRPYKGITIKGLVGTERHFWDYVGLVRGVDLDLAFNDMIKPMEDWGTRITLGGSFVSKYQEEQTITAMRQEDDGMHTYKVSVPKNVGSAAVRLNVESQGFNVGGEYVYKANDPSGENNYIFRSGQALLLNAGYSMKGFGILLQAKSVDNMGFRADRTEQGNFGLINYMPALTRQHVYSLPSLYPYACQSLGEVAFQADLQYKFKRGTALGGKYGTDLKLNASVAFAPERTDITSSTGSLTPDMGTYGYKSRMFHMNPDEVYFIDANLEVSHKFNKNFKMTLMYMFERYNQYVVEGHGEHKAYMHTVVGDFTYMFLKKHALRLELQYLHTKQLEQDWLMGTLEYTFAPTWFVSVSDQWNVGNNDKNLRLHYYYVSAGYIHDATRIALSYGKIREGIMCAGGVCRTMPASNGVMLTISSSF